MISDSLLYFGLSKVERLRQKRSDEAFVGAFFVFAFFATLLVVPTSDSLQALPIAAFLPALGFWRLSVARKVERELFEALVQETMEQ